MLIEMTKMKIGDLVRLEGGKIGRIVDVYEWSPKVYWVRLDGEINIKILVQDAEGKTKYSDLPKAKLYYPFTFRHSGDN